MARQPAPTAAEEASTAAEEAPITADAAPLQSPGNPFDIAPEIWERIRNLRLMDDVLMRVALAGNIPAVQLILRILLDKPDLIVQELTVQSDLKVLISRGLRLDVRATDSQGILYNIEVQRSDSGAHPKRARYHSALMDVSFLGEGEDTDSLHETWVIFITEQDYFKLGQPVYFIERTVTNSGNIPFGDQTHIAYANGAYTGDSDVGRLMEDFRTSDPDAMHFHILADSVRAAKTQQKGATQMSRVLEEMEKIGFDRGLSQGLSKGLSQGKQIANRNILHNVMRKYGWDLEQAMDFLDFPLSEKDIYEDRPE